MCFLEPAQCNFYTRIKQLDLPTQDWYMLEILQERGWKDGNNGGGGFSQVRECGAKAHLSFILYLPLICQQPLIRRLITSDHLISAKGTFTNYFPMISWIYTLLRLFSDVHFGFCSPRPDDSYRNVCFRRRADNQTWPGSDQPMISNNWWLGIWSVSN